MKAQLGAKTHWRDSNDLEMMFQGTYTSEFYRRIRDLLHDQVTLQSKETAGNGGARKYAHRMLERRWQELLAQEQRYRTEGGPSAIPLQGAAGL